MVWMLLMRWLYLSIYLSVSIYLSMYSPFYLSIKGKKKIKVAKEDKDDAIDGMDAFEKEMSLSICIYYLSIYLRRAK